MHEQLAVIIKSVMEHHGGHGYRTVDTGHLNHVVVIDNRLTVRVPRSDDAAKSQEYEAAVLSELSAYTDAPLKIPRLVEVSQHPRFMVCEYIPGHTATDKEITALPAAQQAAIGEAIAEFINWLGQTLSVEKYRTTVAPVRHDGFAWDAYLRQTIFTFRDPAFPSLSNLAQRFAGELQKRYPNGVAAVATRVAHDDLHAGNIILNDVHKPVGIIDFSDTDIGTAAQEMRQLWRTSEVAFKACLARFTAICGEPVSDDLVRFWAELGELSSIIWRIQRGMFGSASYTRARTNLEKWFADTNWTELHTHDKSSTV